MSTRDRPIPADIKPVQAELVHPPRPAPTARQGQRRADPASTFQPEAEVRSFTSLADTAPRTTADRADTGGDKAADTPATPADQPIPVSATRQRATGRHAKEAGQGEAAGRTLVAGHEPAQPVLGTRLGGPADRLAAKQAVFGVFFTWAPGGTLAERTRRGHALLDRLDRAEADRLRPRLAACINIAQAVGGPPPEMARPEPAEAKDVAAIFFRPASGLVSPLARRRQARAILARLSGRPYEQALRLYHAVGALTDPQRDARPPQRRPRREETP
jgi:hypothetical protein